MKQVVALAFVVVVGLASDASCQQMDGAPATAPLPFAWSAPSSTDEVAPVDGACETSPQSTGGPVASCSFGAPRCASATQCTSWCYPLASQCLSGCCACSV